MKKFKFEPSEMGVPMTREELKNVFGGGNTPTASCSWTGSKCELVKGESSSYHCIHFSFSYYKGSLLVTVHNCQAIPNGSLPNDSIPRDSL